MKKVVYTTLCITFVLALSGCQCSKEEQTAVQQEVPAAQQEAAKPAEATETATTAETADQKPVEAQIPAK
ncbi:MAG TPA: hypothetical protein PKD74_00530 [Candidatus Dependentiae bacterium]|nr:hypothetical protein [Candidatus Dependentiae bacterium]